jgi:hypothetical protein
MKLLPLLTLLIGTACAGATLAQTAAKPAPTSAAKSPSKSASTAPRANKPAAKKAVLPPPPPPPLADADEEQLAAVERTYLGVYDCEFKQSIGITRNLKPGYIDVSWQKETFTMKPVLSSTGALRLEDVTGRTLMIQIANKSMLMDTKVGRRLVDECLHPEQRAAIEAYCAAKAAAAAAAAASGVELAADGNGLGIAPTSATR